MKTVDSSVLSDLGLNTRPMQGQTIPMRNCYHGYSDGSRAEVLFSSNASFAQALNKLAILVYESDVILLTYCLMDNHFHLVLYGEEDGCAYFVKEYARRLGMTFSSSGQEIKASLKPLTDDVYLKTAICYVLRNPVIARLPHQPTNYPYSSGFLLFAGKENANPWASPGWKNLLSTYHCQPMSDFAVVPGDADGAFGKVCSYAALSYRDKRMLIGSRKPMPGDWLLAGGFVFPGHYVNYELCERLFGTTRGFQYFMSSCREADFEQNQGLLERLNIPDQEMRAHRDELAHAMFGKFGVRSLTAQERGLLAKKIKREYGCSAKQIARLVHLNVEQVMALIR